MAGRVEPQGRLPRVEVVAPVTSSEPAAEREVERELLRSIVLAIVVMIASWALLVGVALELAGRSLR